MNENSYKDVYDNALKAASDAAKEWLNNAVKNGPAFNVMSGNVVLGQLLDLCGGSYIQFKDARSKEFKEFKKLDFVSDVKIIYLPYKFRERQEYGLHLAAIAAAKKVFLAAGFKVTSKSYVD